MLGPEDIDDLLAKGANVHSIDGDKIGPLVLQSRLWGVSAGLVMYRARC